MPSEYIVVFDGTHIDDLREVFGPFDPSDTDTAISNVQAGKVIGLPRDCKFFVTQLSDPNTLLNPEAD